LLQAAYTVWEAVGHCPPAPDGIARLRAEAGFTSLKPLPMMGAINSFKA